MIGIDDVARVRDELDGELLVFGSAQLVQDLLRRGIVDDLRLVGDGVAILTYRQA